MEMNMDKKMKLNEIMEHPLFTGFPQSINDSYEYGWARGTCLVGDTVYHENWYKWLSILGKGTYQNGDPIPSIHLANTRHPKVMKMLEEAYEPIRRLGIGAFEFVEWIGYAIGIAWFKKPNIPEKEWEHLYKTVDFSLFSQYPSDYLSMFLAENGQNGVLDFFNTPLSIAELINKMLDQESKTAITDCTLDPCIGAGALIIPSNTLNPVGMDMNPIMVRAAAIQAFFYKPSLLYVPSVVKGIHFDMVEMRVNKYFEFNTDTRLYVGNNLIGEFQAPESIFVEDSEWVDIYVQPLDLAKREIYQYEKELDIPWEVLTNDKKFAIVKAMAREIPFDRVVANPPFSAKISNIEKQRIEDIRDQNKLFLEDKKKNHVLFEKVEIQVEEKIELALTDSSKKGVSSDQFMFAF